MRGISRRNLAFALLACGLSRVLADTQSIRIPSIMIGKEEISWTYFGSYIDNIRPSDKFLNSDSRAHITSTTELNWGAFDTQRMGTNLVPRDVIDLSLAGR